MKKINYDEKLKICTTGIDETMEDEHHNRYEPTPYEVLDLLVESGYISKENILLDVGCGKGRVSLYLNHKLHCKTIGIDFNQDLINNAIENKKDNHDIEFKCINAIDYKITNEDCFYFFNPFSIEIFFSVISNIITSYYDNPRSITIFLYYPEDDYLAYMMGLDEFICSDEIDCSEYFKNDIRERIVIFELV